LVNVELSFLELYNFICYTCSEAGCKQSVNEIQTLNNGDYSTVEAILYDQL